MKQLSLTQARARLSTLVAEVDRGKGPVAIAQRSKVKAVLVDAEWYSRVEEELAHYRKAAKQTPLKLRGSNPEGRDSHLTSDLSDCDSVILR